MRTMRKGGEGLKIVTPIGYSLFVAALGVL
jgi:hypothetical protein